MGRARTCGESPDPCIVGTESSSPRRTDDSSPNTSRAAGSRECCRGTGLHQVKFADGAGKRCKRADPVATKAAQRLGCLPTYRFLLSPHEPAGAPQMKAAKNGLEIVRHIASLLGWHSCRGCGRRRRACARLAQPPWGVEDEGVVGCCVAQCKGEGRPAASARLGSAGRSSSWCTACRRRARGAAEGSPGARSALPRLFAGSWRSGKARGQKATRKLPARSVGQTV